MKRESRSGGNCVLRKCLGRRRLRRGLTLLELVVVLTILVALAGIVVPMVSNLLPFSSSAAGATNAAEVERVVQMYLSRSQSNTLDLLDNLAATGGGLVSYLQTNSTATPPDIVPVTLAAPAVVSLNSLGIANVYQLIENPLPATPTVPAWNPTFYPYAYSATGLPVAEALTAGTPVASLSSLAAAQKFGVPDSAVPGTYVVFGLGKYSTMSGVNGGARYLQEAPVAFNPNAGGGPDAVYCRFGLVFQVDPVNGTPATFIGAVQFETTGAITRDDNLIVSGQAH